METNRRRNYIRDRRKQARIRMALVLIGLGIAVFGVVKLIGYFGDMIASRRATQEMREIYYADAPETEDTVLVVAETDHAVGLPETSESGDSSESILSSESVIPSESILPPETTRETEPSVISGTDEPEDARGTEDAEQAGQTGEQLLPARDYPGNPNLKISNQFKHLRLESKDIVGWLTIDRLIDEPVVQRDNYFFLNHDVYGNENVNGAVFMDAMISLKKQPYTYILYGHNMKTGVMFGSMRNYENQTFYHNNPFVSFETMYESGRYVIFAVGNISTNSSDSNFVNFIGLMSLEIQARKDAIEAMKASSVYTCTVDVQPEDQLLLLVTCVPNDEERRIIATRRIRAGEEDLDLIRQVSQSVSK